MKLFVLGPSETPTNEPICLATSMYHNLLPVLLSVPSSSANRLHDSACDRRVE